MKKNIIFLLIFVILSFNQSYTRINNWKVEWSKVDYQELKKSISTNLNRGWLPVGLSGNNNQIFVFYLKADNKIGAGVWSLNWYSSIGALNKGISIKLKKGFMPMGFTAFQGKYWVIYIKGRITTNRHRVVRFANLRTGDTTVKNLVNKGYFPVGITISAGSNLVLMVKDSSANDKMWKIVSHSARMKDFKSALIKEMDKGWIPSTFTYRQFSTYIFYYKKPK